MSSTTHQRPTVVRIWRGRTPRNRADEYEAYSYEAGIKPLMKRALGVQMLREDRENETEFMTISYWESVEAMSKFTGGDAFEVHHLQRDEEFLVELPKEVQILTPLEEPRSHRLGRITSGDRISVVHQTRNRRVTATNDARIGARLFIRVDSCDSWFDSFFRDLPPKNCTTRCARS